MIYNVTVKRLSSDIEEEILIDVSGLKLTCFVTCWVSDVEVGKCYKADMGISVLDELKITEQNSISNNHFLQIRDSFAYVIRGKFDFDTRTVDAGIQIKFDEDELDLYDFAYLDGKHVEFKVDRITLAFLTE